MRWLAVLIASFVAGAGAVMLADPGPTSQTVSLATVGATQVNTGLSGQHVHNADEQAVAALPDAPLDQATRAQLATQLTQARVVALSYPTAADALRSGYQLAGGFAPGTGAHYVSLSGLSGPGPVNVDRPEALLYDGNIPTSQVVGLMY